MKEKVNREELWKFFKENSSFDREKILSLVMNKYGFTKSTAQTYYYDWKKEFMSVPKATKEELKREVSEKSLKQSKPRKKKDSAVNDLEQDNASADSEKETEIQKVENSEEVKVAADMQEETVEKAPIKLNHRLKPVIMQGSSASYKFSESGVERMAVSSYITEESIREDMDALGQWELYYKEVM